MAAKGLGFGIGAFCFGVACVATAMAQQQPIPVGDDAYRAWDRWPEQRIGMRAYMRSTYERSGGNWDESNFLYQLSDKFNVTLDLEGPGIMVFARYNHWHGSPWHYVIDGKDNVFQESSTADPLHPVPDSKFIPSAPFPSPLNETWATTKGADLIWSPIGFEKSFQMAYTRTHYGTGYYIFDRFVPGMALSHPIKSWSESTVPPQDVLDLLSKAGTDIAPTAGTKQMSGKLSVPASGAVNVFNIQGKATVRALSFSIPRAQAHAFQNVHLRVTWDGRQQPSIDAPIALFYGAGTLYNRENKEYLVKALPVSIHFTSDRITLSCYFPMPFFHSAHVELVSNGQAVDGVEWSARTMPLSAPSHQLAYFHATYRDTPQPTPGEDVMLLDTREAENAKEWSGSLVGTSFIFSHNGNLETLEGDPRFFFDDSLTPQAQGTGTEEWGGGGDYWGGLNMTLALAGHPVGARDVKLAKNDEDKIEGAYRFLLADIMPFGKNAVIRLEHGGEDESTEHYETVAYWYGLPSASLVETDRLQIGDTADEKKHGYLSPDASAPYDISSRYEWGVDTLKGKQIYPESQDKGRTTKTTSEFKLNIRPDNQGVMLRRKLDYSFPDQRAEVYVADESKSAWKPAGIWYLAGSNTWVRSEPVPDGPFDVKVWSAQELGATRHDVKVSNRRFRDDDFLLPLAMTQGKKAIWVRVKFTPVNRPLFPGHPLAPQAWSEIRYTAYSFVTPQDVK